MVRTPIYRAPSLAARDALIEQAKKATGITLVMRSGPSETTGAEYLYVSIGYWGSSDDMAAWVMAPLSTANKWLLKDSERYRFMANSARHFLACVIQINALKGIKP